MTSEILEQRYKMLLRFSYGDKEKLVAQLRESIKIYKSSINNQDERCQKRINYYEKIIERALKEQ
jgi:hypothetical protein